MKLEFDLDELNVEQIETHYGNSFLVTLTNIPRELKSPDPNPCIKVKLRLSKEAMSMISDVKFMRKKPVWSPALGEWREGEVPNPSDEVVTAYVVEERWE